MKWWKLSSIWPRTTNNSNDNNFKRESPPFNIKRLTLTNEEASKLCLVVKQQQAAGAQKKFRGNKRRNRVLSLLFGAWYAFKPLIRLSCYYLPGRCVFVGNLIRNFTLYLRVIIYMKKLRTSDWLKTSPFFM